MYYTAGLKEQQTQTGDHVNKSTKITVIEKDQLVLTERQILELEPAGTFLHTFDQNVY